MVIITKEFGNGTIEVMSDCGKYIDGGMIPQQKAIISYNDLQYIREVDKEEVDFRLKQLSLF